MKASREHLRCTHSLNKEISILAAVLLYLIPLPFILLYHLLGVSLLPFGSYSFSIVLGITAFVYFVNQIWLLACPFGFDRALGRSTVRTHYVAFGAAAIILAVFHRNIKVMDLDISWELAFQDPQLLLGYLGIFVLFFTTILSVFLLTKAFRTQGGFQKVYRFFRQTLRLGPKGIRLIQGINIFFLVVIAAHVILATSTSTHPVLAVSMGVYLALALISLLVFKLRGNKALGV